MYPEHWGIDVLHLGNNNNKDNPNDMIDTCEGSFLSLDTQRSYHEEALNIKQGDEGKAARYLANQVQ